MNSPSRKVSNLNQAQLLGHDLPGILGSCSSRGGGGCGGWCSRGPRLGRIERLPHHEVGNHGWRRVCLGLVEHKVELEKEKTLQFREEAFRGFAGKRTRLQRKLVQV